MLWFAAAKSAATDILSALAGRKRPSQRGTGASHGETRMRLGGETNEGFESLPGTPPTGAPFTTWKPSRSNGLSTAAAGCAGAALNLTPDTAPAPGAGFGRGGRSDASATPRCAWITARLGSSLATAITATQLGP